MAFRVTRALDGSIQSFFWRPPGNVEDYETMLSRFLSAAKKKLKEVKKDVGDSYGIKFQVKAKIVFKKFSEQIGREITDTAWLITSNMKVDSQKDVKDKIKETSNTLISRYDGFVKRGSGLSLKEVKVISMLISKFPLIHGGCSKVTLPGYLANSRALIKVNHSTENLCFLYSVASSLLRFSKNRTRSAKYHKILPILKAACKSLHFPFKLCDVKQFEKKIPYISINVYGFEKNSLFPYHITKKESTQYHCNLLLYKNHYFAISNLSPLLANHLRKNRRKVFVCKVCLAYFYVFKKYEMHQILCSGKSRRYCMPTENNNIMKFKNFHHISPAPFVMYCDIESLIFKEQKITEGKLKNVRQHRPISAGGITICRQNPEYSSKPFIYTGEDCIEKLFKFIEEEYSRVMGIIKNNQKPLIMTSTDISDFQNATSCSICLEMFTHQNFKVRDHDHLTGHYRMALCNRCNLVFAKASSEFFIFFHGLGNYDMHFLIQHLKSYAENAKIQVIPKTSEKYLSLKLNNLHFKDTFQFLFVSLAVLAENLKAKGAHYFRHLSKVFINKEQREKCFQKGVYPYNYMTSKGKLYEKQLPPKEAFKNDLSGEHISDKEYEFAQSVWDMFQCKSMKEYTELYLLIDIMLLADIFENFRSNCIENYHLDPVYYFSAPHFTFDAFLRKTKAEIELITDLNQYLFLCKAIRGGVSQVSKRFARANNPYLSNYNSLKPESYLLYIDSNNLYGKALMDYLPCKDFKWMSEEELTPNFILSLDDSSDIGCFIECDLDYPDVLHELHSDFPLAPEKFKVKYKELSPYAQKICEINGVKRTTNSEKLMLTLYPKKNYIVHYRNLKLYVQLGLKIVKIHRGIKFSQAPFIKPYIDFNSQKRSESTNDFDAAYYKLLSNSLFGKTIERPEKRTKVILTTSAKEHEKLVSSLCYKESKIINPNLVGVSMGYQLTKVQKPFYIGAAVLELAKWHMYNFYYNVLKNYFGKNMTLLYTDTDSFVLYISTPNLYSMHLPALQNYFDFSNYPKDHFLFATKFKRIPGYFKDEMAGRHMQEFVALRSKMYSFKVDENETKVAKGVKKSVINKNITHKDYIKCLKSAKQIENDFYSLVSKNHHMFTFFQSKVSLSAFDDKRYLLTATTSLPYGHAYLKD